MSTEIPSLLFPTSAEKAQAMTLLPYKQFLGRSKGQGLSSEMLNVVV